jgi:hypothetical protein
MDAPEQSTCGEGLAESSALPAKIGELLSAMAEVLAAHMLALDLEDVHSKHEFEAYKDLARQLRMIAAGLAAASREMAGYRHLSMGWHDESVLMDPLALEVFERFVRDKQDLLAFLGETIEQDVMMLDDMRRAAAG